MGGRVKLGVQIVVLIVTLSLLCGVAGAMDFYFTDEDANVPGFDGKLMKESVGGIESSQVLSAGDSMWWFSEPMEKDVTFNAGNWKVKYFAHSTGKHRVYTRLYRWNESGLILLGEGYNYVSGDAEKERSFSIDSLSLKKGERICVEINWYKTAGNDRLTLYFNSDEHPSGLEAPPLLTVNQIPEFSPLSLMMVVCLVLGGFVVSRWRN